MVLENRVKGKVQQERTQKRKNIEAWLQIMANPFQHENFSVLKFMTKTFGLWFVNFRNLFNNNFKNKYYL